MNLIAMVAATAAAALPNPTPAITPPVADLAERAPQRQVELIVQQQPGADASAGIRAAGGTIERRVGLINGLLVHLPAGRADDVADVPGVRAVSVNAPIRSLSEDDPVLDEDPVVEPEFLSTAFNQSIRSDRAWFNGITGRGVGVAVIDTGVQGDLADFRRSATDPTSRVAVTAITNPGAESGGDGYGHGTHIAGLIAGNGFNRSESDPLYGQYVGAAPDATLISIKAGDEQGSASVLDVIDGLQFAVDHKDVYNIRVLNLSLSSTVAESHLTDPLDAAAEAAWKAGIVVIAAAGNRGAGEDAVDFAPGNDPWVISVGGVDDMGTRRTRDDELATWSSRGVTQDGYAKPDVLAPGARMVSTMGAGAEYRTLCPTCVVDREYFRVGGTSMAAAVASGAAALIIQAHPRWTPDQVKRAMVRRTRPVLNQSGARVDAEGDRVDAVRAATIYGGEIAVDKVLRSFRYRDPAPANRYLPLNTLLDPATGAIDYTRTSWSRTSWSEAVEALRTSWSRTSWSRTSWSRTSWSATEANCVDLERTSWSRTSWSRTSWSDADLASAREQCDALLASVDPTRTSWSRTSWSRTSWSSSFTK